MTHQAFHDVRFPLAVAFGSSGGPERRTEVVALASGHEERNARWAFSRRRFNAGTGIRSVADIHTLIAFFEERRGQLHGFRWRDRSDWKSGPPDATPTPGDQTIGTGDGVTTEFQLIKTYGGAFAPFLRDITKPVAGTVRVAVDGVEQSEASQFIVDTATGMVSFLVGSIPAAGTLITAGYEFDVPVRFDSDRLTINLAAFDAGDVPSIPIVELVS